MIRFLATAAGLVATMHGDAGRAEIPVDRTLPVQEPVAFENVDPGNSLEDFAGIASMVNEVEDRRRRLVYVAHPALPTRGVQHGLVHVTDGSVAFSRIDMVVNSALPIVVRRAYLSGRTNDREFGRHGWKLTIAERIEPSTRGNGWTYRFGNNEGIELAADGRVLEPVLAATTEIVALKREHANTLSIRLRSGIRKEFEAAGSAFVLTSVSDGSGNSLQLEYADGLLAAVTDSNGAAIELHRDQEGRLRRIDDSFGRSVSYGYDAGGRLHEVTDLRAETWHYFYDDQGGLLTAESPMGLVDLEFRYQLSGRVAEAMANGYRYRFEYEGTETRVTDELSRLTTLRSAESGVTVAVDNWLGTRTEVGLDASGRPESLTRNGLPVSKLHYSDRAATHYPSTQVVRMPGTGTREYVLEFDALARVRELRLASSEPVYRVDRYSVGFLPTRVRYADGSQSRAGLDELGNLRIYRSRDGFEFRARWQGATAEVRSGPRSARLEFDALGRLQRLQTEDGVQAAFSYDPGGLRRATEVSNGIGVEYNYDSSGSLFHTEAGFRDDAKVNFVYRIDEHQRLRSILGSGIDGHHDFDYDLRGRLSRIDSTMINDMSFLYDDAGRLEGVVANGYPPLQYRYDEGEPDILIQLDKRTRVVYDQSFDRSDFKTRFGVYLTRTTPASLGALTYDERLAEFIPSIDPERWAPDAAVELAVENIRIGQLFSGGENGLQMFSMPSSRFFIPPEYWSVNCCYCCPTSAYECEIP